ncbi:MAG: hypothetical protein ABIF19_06350, partial [Planctomycetota bacterium]
MSNRTDFFQSQRQRLAIPAASVSVFVDGMPCPDLEPIEIVRDGWPEFGRARFRYNPAASTDPVVMAVEDIESRFATGGNVCIRQYYNGVPPGAAAFSLPIFSGQIESIETRLAADAQAVEITATDFSANLKCISVFGQRLATVTGSNVFLTGLDTIFNPNGKPNAAATPTEVNGKSYTAFYPETSQAKLWTYTEAIDYLLCECVPSGSLHTPGLSQLTALTEGQTARDLDVTGLNLLEALHRCCEGIGLKFKFVPRQASTGPDQAIVFYKAGTGRTIELNCQHAGQQLSISKTNIAALHSTRNRWPVTHRYIGQGDFKVYEATFRLVKAWDGGLEDTDYDKFSASANPDFYQVKDVYRKWCLNEDGRYSDAPYNQGSAFDFAKVFQSGNFVQRRRRFHPALTTDKLGRSLGYFLQVSFDDNGHSWWQYLYAFNILLDECGIWLSSDQLDTAIWFAALRGNLRFRITASVISDERLAAVVADGPVNSTAPVVDHVITLPRRFKFRKVSDQSIFAAATDETLGIADQVDDSGAMHEFLRLTAATSPEPIETFDVQTPSLMFDCQVGDIVSTSPESRDLLASRSDNRSRSRITRVQMDFEKQC